MAKEKKVSRKDSKGRVLRKGESERKDGTYMFRYNDERKKRCCVYAKTLPELREKELQIERDKMDDIRLSVNYNVQQLMDLYFDLHQKSGDFAITTFNRRKRFYEKHIKNSWIALKKVKDVKKSDIKLFYAELSVKFRKNTLKYVHNIFRQSFAIALDDHIIRTNPTEGALKGINDDCVEKTILTSQQLNSLLDFTEDSLRYRRWYPLIVILSETMLRCGEICGLTWNDVDLKHKNIKIDHQVQYEKVNGKWSCIIRPPKTKKSYRTIPLTDKACKAFLYQKQLQFYLNLHSNVIVDGYSNFVFPTRNGTLNHSQLLDNMFRNLEKSYNTKHPDAPLPHLSCHVFRHTGCALTAKKMFKLGIDPIILQQWMGHASLKMTLNLYNHASKNDHSAAIDEINELDKNIG